MGLKTEFLNSDQSLHSRFIWVGIGCAENLQAIPRNFNPIDDGNMETRQFNLAMEAIG